MLRSTSVILLCKFPEEENVSLTGLPSQEVKLTRSVDSPDIFVIRLYHLLLEGLQTQCLEVY